MAKRKLLKRIGLCALSTVILETSMPVGELVASAVDLDEKQIRDQLSTLVTEQEYPNGMFQFLSPRIETVEGTGYIEFAIVRAGNTNGNATVNFKASDVSAVYGKDYYITVPEFFGEDKLQTEENQSMVEKAARTAEETPVLLAEATEAAPEAVNVTETAAKSDIKETEAVTENAADTTEAIDDQEEVVLEKQVEAPKDLQSAMALKSGGQADYSTWQDRENDVSDEQLISAYNDEYEQLPGAEYTLEFKSGEYMKKLRFYPVDDEVGEDDELVMLTLTDAIGAQLSENPTGLVNIKDNDEYSPSKFIIDEDKVTVSADENSAVITVRRISGIEHMGEVEIKTAEGTALSGTHYESIVTSLSFQAGQEFQLVEVPIKKRAKNETLYFSVWAGEDDNAEIEIEPLGYDVNSQLLEETQELNMTAPENPERITVAGNESNDPWIARPAGDKDWCHGQEWNYNIDNDKPSYHQNGYLINLDLSMVGRLDFNVKNDSGGTYWETGWWFWEEHGYYKDFVTYLDIGNKNIFNQTGSFDKKSVTHYLTDENRTQNFLKYGNYTIGSTKHSNASFSNIHAYYLPIKVELHSQNYYDGAEDRDSYLYTRTYTGVNKYKENETKKTAKFIGDLKFDSKKDSSSYFYNDDEVSLTADYSNSELSEKEKENIYLWGFKVESIDKNIGYYYVEGNKFKISDLYKGNLDAYYIKSDGTKVYTKVNVNNTKFKTSISDNDVPTFKLYPVFRQKQAYVMMTIDKSKSTFNAYTFENNQCLVMGMLDTVEYNIPCYKYKDGNSANGVSSYEISSYQLYAQTSGALQVTSEQVERELYKESYKDNNKKADNTAGFNKIKAYSPYDFNSNTYKNSNWPVRKTYIPDEYMKNQIKITPSELTENNRNEIHIIANYDNASITMGINPSCIYIDGAKDVFVQYEDQIAQYKGVDKNNNMYGTDIIISPMELEKQYVFNATIGNSDKYKVLWTDATGDINKDGKLDADELRALGKYNKSILKDSYSGDSFYYTPTDFMASRQLYYNVIARTPNQTGKEGVISGNVYINKKTVIENTKGNNGKTSPLKGAQVVVAGKTLYTDENGYFEIKSTDFMPGDYYNITINSNGRIYNATAAVNRSMGNIILPDYTAFNINNFKAYTVSNVSEYENKEDWQCSSIDLLSLNNSDTRYKFTFDIQNLSTQIPGKVEVNRYSANGTLKKTYLATAISEKTYLINPTLNNSKSEDSGYYSFNPATENVQPGDYFTIRVYDQNNVMYAEHEVGVTFNKALSVITIANSFKAPYNGVIEFIGQADAEFDLGLVATADAKLTDKVKSLVTISTTQDEETGSLTKTISAGWNKNWKKKDDKDEDKKDDKNKKGKDAADEAKENAKDDKNINSDEAKKLVDKDNENKNKSKVTNDWSADLSIAFQLTMKQNDPTKGWYFEDFVVVATLSGYASVKYSYTTPIGITIFVTAGFGGDITGMIGVERYRDNYQYFDNNGSIDLMSIGMSDAGKKMNFYGQLNVNPYITLGAGVGVDKVASVELKGKAQFNMSFYASGSGAGNVELSGELILELIGGLVTKKWNLGEYKHDLFSYNDGSVSNISKFRIMADENADFRYETVSADDISDRSYLEGQTENFGKKTSVFHNAFSIMADEINMGSKGAEAKNTKTLKTNVYPNAYPMIDTIYEGSGYIDDSQQIMVWLDDDGTQDVYNRAQLMYSVCKNGVWSEPLKVDNDNTLDDTPIMYNMNGERVLILWASADENLTDDMDTAQMMNSYNIKARFFDCKTQTMSDISLVTKTTEHDKNSDYAPSFAYTEKDGKEYLIVNYTKSDYTATGDNGDVLVGDMLNPYSVIGMRIYDFETDSWNDTWGMETVDGMTEADIKNYTENWYGQNFAVLSEYADVNDEAISDENGRWSEKPDSSMITIKEQAEPYISECESIGYDGKAIFAYVADADNDKSTLYDKDIYLQVYDFEKDKMYMPIRLTDNSMEESYIELENTGHGITLYYLSNGNIVSLDITQLMTSGLVMKSDTEADVWLFDKSSSNYTGEITVHNASENMPVTEYIAISDSNNTYLVWPESRTTYKDGIDPASAEATRAENYFEETQLYMMMESAVYSESVLYDNNGNVLTYPETDTNGNVIDYSVNEDVNGETGVVKAGDKVTVNSEKYEWSDVITLTDEQGANFTDIDFVISGNGILKCVYLKGMSEVMNINGTDIAAENTNKRSLMVSDFDLNVTNYTAEFENLNSIEALSENTPVNITAKNCSVLNRENVKVELYADDVLVGTETIEQLNGGQAKTVSILWDTPENINDVTLKAVIKEADVNYTEVSETLEYHDSWCVNEVSTEIIDRDTAEITATVENIGSQPSDELILYVYNGDKSIAQSEAFALEIGEVKQIKITVPIDDNSFINTEKEDGSIEEIINLTIEGAENNAEANIIREADKSIVDEWNEIDKIIIKDEATSEKIENSISMKIDDVYGLSYETLYKNGNLLNSDLTVLYESSDESVVSVIDGHLVANKNGTAVITVTKLPQSTALETLDSGYMFASDETAEIPSQLFETEKIIVTVSDDGKLLGDANEDGVVNVRDAAFIAKALAKGEEDTLPDNSDYNQDGKINVRDAAAIAKYLAQAV